VSLVNLIMEREVVRELLQSALNEQSLERELRALLEDDAYRQRMGDAYRELWSRLGSGDASEKAAAAVFGLGSARP
jgi:lipid-A-disaccharide synthase